MKFVDRHPKKSRGEAEFDELNAQYYRKFGSWYTIQMFIGPDQWDEINADLRKCLKDGKPQKLKTYDKDLVY